MEPAPLALVLERQGGLGFKRRTACVAWGRLTTQQAAVMAEGGALTEVYLDQGGPRGVPAWSPPPALAPRPGRITGTLACAWSGVHPRQVRDGRTSAPAPAVCV